MCFSDLFESDLFDATLFQANGSVLVIASGEIDINTAGAFAAALEEAAGWSRRVVVDLQHVEFIGVAGLNVLQLVLRQMNSRFGMGEIIILAPPTSLTLMSTVVTMPHGLTISTTVLEEPSPAALIASGTGST